MLRKFFRTLGLQALDLLWVPQEIVKKVLTLIEEEALAPLVVWVHLRKQLIPKQKGRVL